MDGRKLKGWVDQEWSRLNRRITKRIASGVSEVRTKTEAINWVRETAVEELNASLRRGRPKKW